MPIKIKVLNKYFALITYSAGSPRIEPNPFELAKQFCLMEVEKNNLPLPRFNYDVYKFEDDYPDLAAWLCSLTQPNSPTKVAFKSNPQRFRELVEPLDFSKPYDKNLIQEIHNEFSTVMKKQEINADDLINAELTD